MLCTGIMNASKAVMLVMFGSFRVLSHSPCSELSASHEGHTFGVLHAYAAATRLFVAQLPVRLLSLDFLLVRCTPRSGYPPIREFSVASNIEQPRM